MLFIFQVVVDQPLQHGQNLNHLQNQSQTNQKIQTQTLSPTPGTSSAAAVLCLTLRPPSGTTCFSSKTGGS